MVADSVTHCEKHLKVGCTNIGNQARSFTAPTERIKWKIDEIIRENRNVTIREKLAET